MKQKDLLIDWLGSSALKLLGPVVRKLPLGCVFWLGSALGALWYYVDARRRAQAYAHIKKALGQWYGTGQLRRHTKAFYRGVGQNFIELFLIPLMNRRYMDRYVAIEGRQYPQEALKKGKGVIMVSVHSGSWELSSLVCASMGLDFSLLVREQHFVRLNALLTEYRKQSGFKLIQRQGQVRQLIRALKENQAIGMSADQGGKSGQLVDFFGHQASMAAGAIALSLKYGAPIIPSFYTRVKGPYFKTILHAPFELHVTGDEEKDIRDNLQRLTGMFEELIRKYPDDYLWPYKIWKYGRRKKALILSDGKAGHLRQSQAVADELQKAAGERNIRLEVTTLEVQFKNAICRAAFKAGTLLSGKYNCQGCLGCLRRACLTRSYQALCAQSPDIVISAGASLAGVTSLIAGENQAKSIVVMRPGLLSTGRFDLVVVPAHDLPARRKNVVVTQGALNLIDRDYVKNQADALRKRAGEKIQGAGPSIGLLIGGDAKGFTLSPGTVALMIAQVKALAQQYDARILVTTSRRTSAAIEALVIKEFSGVAACRLLVIANQQNIPEAVGGIIGLSRVLVVSPESISMVSEAASSDCYTVVFDAQVDRRHERFLRNLAQAGHIYRSPAQEIGALIQKLLTEQPQVLPLDDRKIVHEALTKIL